MICVAISNSFDNLCNKLTSLCAQCQCLCKALSQRISCVDVIDTILKDK